MGGLSLWHWIIVGGIVLVLFGGKGKISDLMGDFAKGIKSFKKGLTEEDPAPSTTPAPVEPARSIDLAPPSAHIEKTGEARRVG